MIRRIFCALLCTILLAGGARAESTPDLVRLHIVAADNSSEAQSLKRELRDTCLRCARVCLSNASNADDAYMRLRQHVGDFENACTARAQELGYNGRIVAETGVFDFPNRIYGQMIAPAGAYRALRITIGEGAGHNWWCILYPTLCLLNEEHAAAKTPNPQSILSWLRPKIGG